MLGLEISSVPPILPILEHTLHPSFRQLQWVMAAYTVAMTTILMAVGTLADRFGRKRVFMIGIAAFGLASLVCGSARTAELLIASRVLQGLSAAAMLICQVAILSTQFRDGQRRSAAFAWWGIVFGTGLGFGPIVGECIVILANWTWVFLVHVVLAAVTFALAAAGVQESRDPQPGSLDFAGIISLSLGVFCLVLFVTQGPSWGFGSFAALGTLAVSIASIAAFVVVERMHRRPMIDFSVFRIPEFSGALLGSAGMNFSFWPFMIYLPIYFHSGLGYDSVHTGLALLAYTLPTLFVPPFAERLAQRLRSDVVIPLGLSTIGAGFLLMKLASLSGNTGSMMLVACAIAGTGLGLTNTPVSNSITAAAPRERAGMASGADMSGRMISLAFNIALMGLLLVEAISASLQHRLNLPASAALRAFAERLASGEALAPASHATTIAGAVASPVALHPALIDGFEALMVYGACSAFAFALGSRIVFARGVRARQMAEEEACRENQGV
jgi:EmrB/QacA subfamily drug resistance transporter